MLCSLNSVSGAKSLRALHLGVYTHTQRLFQRHRLHETTGSFLNEENVDSAPFAAEGSFLLASLWNSSIRILLVWGLPSLYYDYGITIIIIVQHCVNTSDVWRVYVLLWLLSQSQPRGRAFLLISSLSWRAHVQVCIHPHASERRCRWDQIGAFNPEWHPARTGYSAQTENHPDNWANKPVTLPVH